MARPLSRAALLLLAPLLLAAEPAPAPAKVGLRIAPLPDSVVVTEVIPGMGADQAGLRVGDVLLTRAVTFTLANHVDFVASLCDKYSPSICEHYAQHIGQK